MLRCLAFARGDCGFRFELVTDSSIAAARTVMQEIIVIILAGAFGSKSPWRLWVRWKLYELHLGLCSRQKKKKSKEGGKVEADEESVPEANQS